MTQLILFIAVVSVTTLFVGALVVEVGLYSQAIGDEGERAGAAIDAEITIVNDPDAGGTYDEDTETVTLYVKNVGGSTLEPADLDVLLDGEYVTSTAKTVRDGDHWRPGRVLEITIDRSLERGWHRVLVSVGGVQETLSFEYAFDHLVWDTSADWSEGVHERTVSDDVGDRDRDTVRLGYGSDDDGLNAYWTLDESDGDTAFDAASSNDGSHLDGTTLGRTGLIGTTAYGFDGQGARIEVPDDETLRFEDEMTLSLWLNTNELGSSPSDNNQVNILGKSTWSERTGYVLYDNGDNSDEIVYRVMGNDDFYDVTIDRSLVNDGTWHHLVAVSDNGETRLYLDGEQQATQTGTALDPSDNPLGIGAEWWGEHPYEGDLDEIQLYDRALSGNEIESLYRTTVDGTHTTAWRTVASELNAEALQLENVSAMDNDGTITVYVESDLDDDGSPNETSDPIVLSDATEYAVDGITTDNDRFRLRIEFEASDVTSTPVVSQIELTES
ncbi:LamG-like jellyroll fold domain-containing protein [Natronoglomus mannanivorans]|uniref:LamG-like jellyroll fold domain-containing protein n=1 Tax=Natronoglomus mannanivorans TaxID=2979990 RepID=A0AAP2Z2W3_9EURY|nr:hypothetical protein [Halobacteria archaeon AArc-xg1-1]